jgi:hypothetical protein
MTDVTTREADEICTELAELEAAIDECTEGNRERFARRIELLQRGQELGLTVRTMADRAGRKEGAYGQVLHKAKRT